MEKHAELVRTYQEIQTIGTLTLFDEKGPFYTCKTIELPWKDNARRISCIPEGTYEVVKRSSTKYGSHFHILDVLNRDMILIHVANYSRELLGCIGVGSQHVHIDKDGWLDVIQSKDTLKDLNSLLPASFKLTIKKA